MARHLKALAQIGIALSCVVAPLVSQAQRVRPRDPNAAGMMVTVFRSPDAQLGIQAAEAVRSALNTKFPSKQLYVLQREEINGYLTASGFPTNEPLQPHDMKALAQLVRADEYLQGTATRTPNGYKIEAALVLTRDNSLVQPLGAHEANNLTNTAGLVANELKEARKQIDAEKACFNNAREQKWDVAMASAREGIAAYPKSTLARICLANVMIEKKAAPAELLAVGKEIVALDDKSSPGLRLIARAYQDLGQQDSMVITLARLLRTDPTNAAMVSEVVEVIAGAANPRVARPIIEEAVVQNPGDPELLRLRWRILMAVRDYKEAFTAGEELVRLDTANADTTYFIRTVGALVADSQAQKAAEMAGRGVAKFPSNPSLVFWQITTLRQAGQTQQALEVLDRALSAGVPVSEAGVLKIAMLRDLNRMDEIIPVARELIAKGSTTTGVRQAILGASLPLVQAAQKSGAEADYQKALAALSYADSVTTGELKVQSQYWIGVGNLLYGQLKLQQAQAQQSCDLLKQAKNHFADAQLALPKGGAFDVENMRKYMGAVMQLDSGADQLMANMKCK